MSRRQFSLWNEIIVSLEYSSKYFNKEMHTVRFSIFTEGELDILGWVR